MRALRYYGAEDMRLEHDVPEPICDAHQVKIRPSFCGICGSDLHFYCIPDALPFKDTPHPITGDTWPVTLGHEFSGDIVEVGAQVRKGLKVGDRVAVQPTICCNQCVSCKGGFTNCCDSFGFVGIMGWGGGLSDRVCVDAQFVFKLPEKITSEIGALVEPLAVAWHAIEQSAAKAGDSILVIGAGPIGLAILQCLKALHTAQVIVAEVAQKRRDLALQFGATAAIDPTDEDMVSRCKTLCNDQGPDVVFDCAGVAASIKSACLSVRSRGTVVNVAQWGKDIPFKPDNLLVGEKRLVTSKPSRETIGMNRSLAGLFRALSYTSENFERVTGALDEGTIDAEKMITRTISMDRVVEDGILALLHEKDKHVKILVDVRK